MSVFGLMVTRNEADRYLECALTHLRTFVDGIVVFDDRSEDETTAVCRLFTPWVGERPDSVPPFLEHEGRFRRAAWLHLERSVNPAPGDWVVAVDADEVLVCNERSSLARLAREATAASAAGVALAIPEVFQLDPLAVRTDRMWAGQRTPRLFEWRPDARFPFEAAEELAASRGPLPPMGNRRDALAGGCGPTYGMVDPVYADPPAAQLLHLGYADPADRKARHARYQGRRGHNPTHVASILASPHLEPWQGPPVDVWRGIRAG